MKGDDTPVIRKFTSIIADDHAIVREGLRAALEKPGMIEDIGIEVVAEAENGVETIGLVRQFSPNLLVLDMQMPLAGGTETLLEVRRWAPDTKVVVLTGISATGKLAELIEIGVDGLFSKATSNEALFAAIPKILRGGRAIAPHILELIENAEAPAKLTMRERQALNLIMSGRSNKEIAAILGISAKTVDRHRTSLMQKLEVHSVAQLVARALREGLIDASGEL